MGFKVDSSFLRFLTMGAVATRRVMSIMEAEGLLPIELERHSSCNKIWNTKVKRLRLPDILCVASGIRVEARAKSDLTIKMSDAPDNQDRRWFSGLSNDDFVAFVQCESNDGQILPAETAELFRVQDLHNSSNGTRLGPPKSASEGSERDREWPATVARNSGEVLEVNGTQIRTRLDSGRNQTYRIAGKSAYVVPGQRFRADVEFIAGLPRRKATFTGVLGRNWDPRPLINGNPIDKYVLAKALGRIGTRGDYALLHQLRGDLDRRVALEAAGSLAKLGAPEGLEALLQSVEGPAEPYLRIEAVFILSELRQSPLCNDAVGVLVEIAGRPALAGDEARQAAIWGLGFAGLQHVDRLIPFLGTDDEDERTHAVVAFGSAVPDDVALRLVRVIADDNTHIDARASASLVIRRLAANPVLLQNLIQVATNGSPNARIWSLMTLGLMAPDVIAAELPAQIRDGIRPLQMLSPQTNWTEREAMQDALKFVGKQTVF